MGARTKGLRSARRHRLAARTNAIEMRDRTNPTTSEYDRPHFLLSLEARHLLAAVASGPCKPSTEKTRGVKWRRRSRQGARYFVFFSFSCLRRTLIGSWLRYVGASVSVIRTSKIAVVPRRQNPWTATSPRVSAAASTPVAPAAYTPRPVLIKGSSETAEGWRAWAQRWCHSAATSLWR